MNAIAKLLSIMIDTHCHLADRKFSSDLVQVLERAREQGIESLITIGDSIEESMMCMEIAEENEEVYCSVGVHPHESKQWGDGDGERLRSCCAASKKVVAIGEIGLDYHYDFSPREVQREVFRKQLLLAQDLGLPAVIHNRESIADLRAIVEEVLPPELVLHCCTETFGDVSWLLKRGYFLSFTGIATYPDAEKVRETIRKCPLERLMLETDAPYLAPLSHHRRKRNEPAFVVEVAKAVAKIKDIPLLEVERVTTENAKIFFGLY